MENNSALQFYIHRIISEMSNRNEMKSISNPEKYIRSCIDTFPDIKSFSRRDIEEAVKRGVFLWNLVGSKVKE